MSKIEATLNLEMQAHTTLASLSLVNQFEMFRKDYPKKKINK